MKKIVAGLMLLGASAFAESLCSHKYILTVMQNAVRSVGSEIVDFGRPISVKRKSEAVEICTYEKMILKMPTEGKYIGDYTYEVTLDFQKDFVNAKLIYDENERYIGR